MAQPLLPDKMARPPAEVPATSHDMGGDAMADLKVFWGPELCRLEYLIHLLETGRVKDDGVAGQPTAG